MQYNKTHFFGLALQIWSPPCELQGSPGPWFGQPSLAKDKQIEKSRHSTPAHLIRPHETSDRFAPSSGKVLIGPKSIHSGDSFLQGCRYEGRQDFSVNKLNLPLFLNIMEFQTILSYLSCPSFSGCAGIASALNSSAFRQAELLDKAGSSTKIPLEASARKKKKRHRCEKCMLVVFDVLNIYEPIDHDGWQNADQSSIAARVSGGLEWDTLFLQDLIWDGQAGPKCAAASVSSLALSFASTYGLPG